MCLFPHCEAKHFDVIGLESHVQEHFTIPGADAAISASGSSVSSHPPSSVTGGPLPTNSAAVTEAGGRFGCPRPGCNKTFGRAGDLERHTKKHQDGPKEHDCPIRDCPRQGTHGFTRKDKLNDHLKAKHKMSAL